VDRSRRRRGVGGRGRRRGVGAREEGVGGRWERWWQFVRRVKGGGEERVVVRREGGEEGKGEEG